MKVLLVYSHADDEIIFGWPFLFNRKIERSVLICSNGRKPQYQGWEKPQQEALAAVCEKLGVTEHHLLPYDAEFYKLRTRGAGDGPLLKEWWNTAQLYVEKLAEGCDLIVTHSPWGEYGHLDHCLVHRCVREMYPAYDRPRMVWTDAYYKTSTWPLGDFKECTGEEAPEFDYWLYEALKKEYTDRGCWSWDNPVPFTTKLIYEDVR